MAKTILIFLFLMIAVTGVSQKYANYSYSNTDWPESYFSKDRRPYGGHVLYELLRNTYGIYNVELIKGNVHDYLQQKPKDITKATYFFLGREIYFRDIDYAALLDFAENGNNVFIAAEYLPDTLQFTLFHNYWRQGYDSTYQAVYRHPQGDTAIHEFTYLQNFEGEYTTWHYFPESDIKNLQGCYTIKDSFPGINRLDFAVFNYGEGKIIIHSNPLLFTNLSVLSPSGKAYMDYIFGSINTQKIFWDDYTRIPYNDNPSQIHWTEQGLSGSDGQQPPPQVESPLAYILSKPPLKYGYFSLLSLLILFALFKTKRRQQIIPLKNRNTNSSLEFAATVGKLYQQLGSHRTLVLQKEKLFLNFIRKKYYMTTAQPDEDFINRLSKKSQVSQSNIKEIFQSFKAARTGQAFSGNELVSLQKKIESFYKNAQ